MLVVKKAESNELLESILLTAATKAGTDSYIPLDASSRRLVRHLPSPYMEAASTQVPPLHAWRGPRPCNKYFTTM